MSYDLEVITRHQPKHAAIVEFGSGRTGFAVEGSLGKAGICLSREEGDGAAAFVDDPLRLEEEDVEPVVSGRLEAARWLVRISMPASRTEDDVTVAFALAEHLARLYDGVVYDPQTDRIVWPRTETRDGRVRDRRAREDRRPTDLLELHWFFCPAEPASEEERARSFLRVVRDIDADALPRRYGGVEPFQHRLDRDGDDDFAGVWREEREIGGSLMWTSQDGSEGLVSFPLDSATRIRPGEPRSQVPGAKPAAVLGIAASLADAEQLLVGVASAIGSFYAVAGPGSSDELVLVHDVWLGIPPVPAWRVWAGGGYRDALATVPGAVEEAGGLLFRPVDRAKDARRARLPIPAEFVWRTEASDECGGPEQELELSDAPARVPAYVIPDLT